MATSRSDAAAEPVRRRPEGEEDSAFLFALFSSVQGGPFAGFDPALRAMLLRQGFEGQRMTYRARYPGARFEMVEVAGGGIGRIVTDRAVDALTRVDIALLPEWRGRGLGTRLIAETVEEAGAAGLPLRLTVAASNPGARRLYERLGFVPAQTSELHLELVWTPRAAPGAEAPVNR